MRLGPTRTTDSVVMLLQNRDAKDYVVKWNRSNIISPTEAAKIVMFSRKSLDLYKAILGEEYIIPTEFVIGEKQDGNKTKIKVYEVQPYISGWDGRSLPEDLRQDEHVVDDWRRLYARASLLYIIGNRVNRETKRQSGTEFPINLTLGISRTVALSGNSDLILNNVPRTPNLLIDRLALQLHLCDFGAYTPWDERMQEAYQEIHERTLSAINSLEGLPQKQ